MWEKAGSNSFRSFRWARVGTDQVTRGPQRSWLSGQVSDKHPDRTKKLWPGLPVAEEMVLRAVLLSGQSHDSLTSTGSPFTSKNGSAQPWVSLPTSQSLQGAGRAWEATGRAPLRKMSQAQEAFPPLLEGDTKPTPQAGLLCCLPTVPPWTCWTHVPPTQSPSRPCPCPVLQGTAPSPVPGCLP